MRRFITNYLFAPDLDAPRRWQLYINHIATLDSDGNIVAITPFDHELPNTRHYPTPIALAPVGTDHELIARIIRDAASPADALRTLNATTPPTTTKKPVEILSI